VHVVRHPAHHARSMAGHLGVSLTDTVLLDCLKNWVAVVEKSREHAATGCFFEVRYEDLAVDCERSLAPVLQSLGLSHHARCSLAAQRQYGPLREGIPLPRGSASHLDAVPQLRQIMAQLRYDIAEFKSTWGPRFAFLKDRRRK